MGAPKKHIPSKKHFLKHTEIEVHRALRLRQGKRRLIWVDDRNVEHDSSVVETR